MSISKAGGTTLSTTKTFQVRIFTANEDIAAIKEILESKTGNDLIITLSGDSTGGVLNNQNQIEIIKKLRILIDPSNINGDPNHPSLRGTNVVINTRINKSISRIPQYIDVFIGKTSGTTLAIDQTFQVKKH